ncbi:hypothetical protein ONS96_011925 [Cadophora gregata f. sp. sojae]|nr:hypothetical protein ONS96_011925 [Cadophora gregata f. sp. sojae]
MVHTDAEWLTAQDIVESALRDAGYACQSLERLPGGFIDFSFRNKLATPINGHRKAVVVKMTEEKLKIEKTMGDGFTLQKAPSYYEHQLLSHEITSYNNNDQDEPAVLIRVPTLLEYLPSNYIQIIEDLPNTSTLKAHLLVRSFEPAFAKACERAVGA